MSTPTKPRSPRVRVKRMPARGAYDRASIDAVLDAALVAHVAVAVDGQPFCVPVLHARVDDHVYVHGSSASRLHRALATGAPACLTVTLIDGVVLARSIFNHSTNYRSAMLLGSFSLVDEKAEKLAALEAFSEKLLPGRWAEVREPTAKELKATTILGMAIDEASAKCRVGPPGDDGTEDAEQVDAWAGVVPIVTTYGEPIAAPGLRPGIPLSPSVAALARS